MLTLIEVVSMAITDLILHLNIIYGSILLLMGLLFAALTYPLRRGMVKMNYVYGVRFPQSYYSDDAWYKINAYGGKLLMIWGVLLAMAGALLIFIPIADYAVGLTIFLALLATMIVPVVLMYNYARTFKRPNSLQE